MKILGKIALLPVLIYSVVVRGPEATPLRPEVIHYDGADWRLRGEGVVACPCQVPLVLAGIMEVLPTGIARPLCTCKSVKDTTRPSALITCG